MNIQYKNELLTKKIAESEYLAVEYMLEDDIQSAEYHMEQSAKLRGELRLNTERE